MITDEEARKLAEEKDHPFQTVRERELAQAKEQLAAREVRISQFRELLDLADSSHGNGYEVWKAWHDQVKISLSDVDDLSALREHEAKVLEEAADKYASRYADPKLGELDEAVLFLRRMAKERRNK